MQGGVRRWLLTRKVKEGRGQEVVPDKVACRWAVRRWFLTGWVVQGGVRRWFLTRKDKERGVRRWFLTGWRAERLSGGGS